MAALDFINNNLYMNIASVSREGQPWNTPVFFAHADNKLYWFSAKASVHSKNIEENEDVFITIYDSTVKEGEGKGLYVKAAAYLIEDAAEIEKAVDVYNDKAHTFKITDEFVSPQSPNGLYCADIIEMWTNDGDEVDGDYVDIRKEL